MKVLNIIKTAVLALTAALAAVSCGSEPASLPAEISAAPESLAFAKEGGDEEVILDATRDWETEISYVGGDSEDWLTVNPVSGAASAEQMKVTVSAGVNAASDREAVITFRADFLTSEVRVFQEGAYSDYTTIEEFLAAPVNQEDWYLMRGTIFLIESGNGEEYGNFWIKDATGILYVYGLTSAKVDKNDKSFSQLGLETGDVVMFRTLRSEHYDQAEAGGSIPAYYVSHTDAEDAPESDVLVSDPVNGWMELPGVEATDDQVYVSYYTEVDGDPVRNYSMLYDASERVALWVAYPLCDGYTAVGGRTDYWNFDPRIPDIYEPVLAESWGSGTGYDRGHQIPSASRSATEEMNRQTFYFANMTAQNSEFNQGIWATLEEMARDWAADCDTLYVVTGPVLDADGDGEIRHIEDNAGNPVAVPEAYFKALLSWNAAADEYRAAAFYFENREYTYSRPREADMLSVADLEKLTGLSFFTALPDEIEAEVKGTLDYHAWN